MDKYIREISQTFSAKCFSNPANLIACGENIRGIRLLQSCLSSLGKNVYGCDVITRVDHVTGQSTKESLLR